jgi:hypothetical protein
MNGQISKNEHTKASFLSPTFYSLYMAGLKSKLNQNFKFVEYADDVAVYSIARHSSIGVAEVEKSIQSTEIYLKESGLEIAPNKCQLCIFDKKGKPMEIGISRYEEKRFLQTKSIKFLSLHLKFNLNWKDKINAIIRMCETPIKIVNCVKHI